MPSRTDSLARRPSILSRSIAALLAAGALTAAARADLIVDGNTIHLSTPNSYTGDTFIRSTGTAGKGILDADVANAFPTGTRTNLTMDDGTSAGGSVLNLNNGFGQAVASITSPNSAIGATSIIQLGTATLTVGNSSAASVATFYGSIRGTGGLTKDGVSTQILAGANTYIGATNVTKGTLQLGTATNAGALSASSAIDLTTGGTLALVKIAGNTFANSVTSDSGGPGGTLLVNSAANNTLSGALTDSGAGQLTFTQSGTGTTILTNAANNYRGVTTVTSGTLQVGSAAAAGSLGTNANVVVTTGGNLSLVNIAGDTFSQNISNGVSGLGTFTITSARTNTVSGKLSDGPNGQIALVQNGTGTTILTNAGNNYTGATTVSKGTLQIGNVTTAGKISNSSAVTVTSGATLSLVNLGGNTFGNDVSNGTGGTGTLLFASANTNTLTGALTDGAAGQLAVKQIGSGTTILRNTGNTYSGATTVSGGTLQIGAGGSAGSLSVNSAISIGTGGTLSIANIAGNTTADAFANNLGGVGTLDINSPNTITLSGLISNGSAGTLGLTQEGSGTTILTNANNSYSGGTTVTGGTLQLGTFATAGRIGANSAVSITTGGTLQLINTGSNTFANKVTNGVGGTGTLDVATITATTTLSGQLSDGAAGRIALTFDAQSTGYTLVVANTTNSYSGNTTINNGTLQVGNSTAAGSLGSSAVRAAGGTTLLLTKLAGNQFINDVTATGSGAVAVNINASGTNTLSGALKDGGAAFLSLNQNGPGTTIIIGTGSNYRGATNINNGALQIGNSSTGGSIGSADAVAVTGGTTLFLTNVAGTNFSNDITNATGGIGTVNANGAGTVNLSGVLSDGAVGQLTLTQSGSGTAILTNANNTYSGATKVTGGVLQIGQGGTVGSLGAANSVSVGNNGTLSIVKVAGNNFTKDVSNGIGGVGTLDINSNGPMTISGNLTNGAGGTLSLAQSGNGTTTLTSAVSNYTGATIVRDGTLQLGTAGVVVSLSPSSTVNLTTGGTLSLVNLNNNTFSNKVSNGTGGVGTLNVNTAATFTLTSAITDGSAGQVALSQTGAGTTILKGTANTYSGDTTISNGILQIGVAAGAGRIGPNSTINVGNGATLLLVNVSGGVLGNNITNSQANTGLIDSHSTAKLTLGGTIADGPGKLALTQGGAGTLVVTGTDHYTGATTVNAGTLQVGNGTTVGTTIAASGTVQVNAGATLATDLSTGSAFANAVSLNAINTSLNAIQSGINTLSGVISGSGALNQNGTGTTILAANDIFTGATKVNAGALQVGDGSGPGNLTGTSGVTVAAGAALVTDLSNGGTFADAVNLNGSTAAFNAVQSGTNIITGQISGTGTFTQNGAGTTRLNNTELYTGATKVNAGTLTVNGSLAAASAVTVAAPGTLAGNGTINGNVVLNGGTTSFSNPATIVGTLKVTGGNWAGSGTVNKLVSASGSGKTFTVNGNLTALAGVTVSSGFLAGTGTITGNLNYASTSSSTFGGVLAGAASTLTKSAGSTLTLTGQSTFGGGTKINAGNLVLGDATTHNAALGSGTVTIASTSGTLTFDLANGETFSNAIADNGHLIATGLLTNNYIVASPISGTGTFAKTGGNTVTLSNANSYTGATTISGGTLLVTNTTGSATGTGAVAVNNFGTLGGSGTIAKAVTLNNGGTIAPGAGSSGTAGTTLHDFSLKWNGGGTMEFQLGDTSDQLALTGALTKGSLGAYTIDLVDAGITQSSYTLATFASTTFAPANFTLELPAGYTGNLVETGTSLSVDLTFVGLAALQPAALVTYGTEMTQSLDQATSDSASQLVVTPAPEPGSALLLTFGGSALLGWRRRRQA